MRHVEDNDSTLIGRKKKWDGKRNQVMRTHILVSQKFSWMWELTVLPWLMQEEEGGNTTGTIQGDIPKIT